MEINFELKKIDPNNPGIFGDLEWFANIYSLLLLDQQRHGGTINVIAGEQQIQNPSVEELRRLFPYNESIKVNYHL